MSLPSSNMNQSAVTVNNNNLWIYTFIKMHDCLSINWQFVIGTAICTFHRRVQYSVDKSHSILMCTPAEVFFSQQQQLKESLLVWPLCVQSPLSWLRRSSNLPVFTKKGFRGATSLTICPPGRFWVPPRWPLHSPSWRRSVRVDRTWTAHTCTSLALGLWIENSIYTTGVRQRRTLR